MVEGTGVGQNERRPSLGCASKSTIGVFVSLGRPFAQGVLQRIDKLEVHRRGLAQADRAVDHVKRHDFAGVQAERLPDTGRNRGYYRNASANIAASTSPAWIHLIVLSLPMMTV